MAVTPIVALKYVAFLLEQIADAWSFPLLSLQRIVSMMIKTVPKKLWLGRRFLRKVSE
jgi:hypothetical protein